MVSRIRTGDVAVEGLAELQRALKAMGDVESSREVRAAGKEAATYVAGEARGTATSLGGVAAHVAPSIKASAGATNAGVSFGGAAYPMAAGAEFGGRGRPTTQQFQPWRGSGPGSGYFVYPSITDHVDEIVEPYEQAIQSIARKAGL